jgi:hypothetical protein
MTVDWAKVIETILGPLIGAAVALVAIWLKEIYDRRRELQTWYEEHYLREGLDRITSHIMAVEYCLNANPDDPAVPEEVLKLPVEAITRIQVALQSDVFTQAIPMLHWATKYPSLKDTPVFKARQALTQDLRRLIDELRKEMLKADIKRKTGVYDIANRPRIKQLNAQIDQRIRETHASIAIHALDKISLTQTNKETEKTVLTEKFKEEK